MVRRIALALGLGATSIEVFAVRVGIERDAGGYLSGTERPQDAAPGPLRIAESVVPFVGIGLTGGTVALSRYPALVPG